MIPPFDILFAAANGARNAAHAPYSNFHVGAALVDERGRVHVGANIENAAFPEGWCAETSAISHLVMAGGKRIAAAVVVAPRIPGGGFCTPCGGCRQRLAEFGGPDVPVVCADPDGVSKTYTLGELLPGAFSLEAGR
jgi:cytidine deaminase